MPRHPPVLRRTVHAPYTGDAWRLIEAKARAAHQLDGGAHILGLAFSSDKSQTRAFGQATFWPMYALILNEEGACSRSPRSRLLLGYIYCAKKLSGARQDLFSAGTARMWSASWKLVLDQLQAMGDAPEAALHVRLSDGQTVLKLVPKLVTFVGDHPEVQTACGVSASAGAAFPCRACHVPWAETHRFFTRAQQKGPKSVCKPRTSEQVIEGTADALCIAHKKDRQKALKDAGSLNGAPTCFNFYSGWATDEGVMHATPQDPMHHFGQGLAPDLIGFIGEQSAHLLALQ